MPRNGSDIYYIPPGTEGFPDTTIESAKYNTYIHDVETDLNRPRPISAGGTGANNANDALSNLGAEKSSQAVTNYDTHVFLPGSFYSAPGATDAPIAGHAFVGIVVSSDPPAVPPANLNLVLRAYDQSSTVVPGRIYVREKKAGVWGPWSQDNTGVAGPTPPADPPDNLLWWDSEGGHLYTYYNDGNSKQWVIASPFADPAQFLLKAGDTMLGTLTLNSAPTVDLHAVTKKYVDDIATGASTTISGKVSKTGDTMSGALLAPVKGHVFGNASGTLATAIVNRNDAAIKLYDNGGENWCGMGADTFGRMWFKGGTTGGLLPAMYIEQSPSYNVVVNTGIHCAGSGGISSANRITTTSEAAGFFANNSNFFGFNGDGTLKTFYFTSNARWIYNDSSADLSWNAASPMFVLQASTNAMTITGTAWKPGGGSWQDSSDERIKNVEGDYTRGLAEVAQLRPVFYTHKGNDTPVAPAHTDKDATGPVAVPYPNSPHYSSAEKGRKFTGLVAQEVETVIPEMVTQRAAYIDGVAVTDLRDLDTTPLIFALVNSIKELKARIEVLEGN